MSYELDHGIQQSRSRNRVPNQNINSVLNQILGLDSVPQGYEPLMAGLTLDPLFLLNFQDILASGKRHSGVSEEFMDSLKRLDRSQLSSDENCAICTSHFLSDEYPLVVELNCKHKFDLECIKPWLSTNSTCPLCRSDVQQPKKTIELEDSEEEYDEMYG